MKMSPCNEAESSLAGCLAVGRGCYPPLAVVAQNPHSAPVNAPAKLTDAQLSERVCYMLGRSIAEDCKRGEVKLDMQSLSAGIADFAAGKDSRWERERTQCDDASIRRADSISYCYEQPKDRRGFSGCECQEAWGEDDCQWFAVQSDEGRRRSLTEAGRYGNLPLPWDFYRWWRVR